MVSVQLELSIRLRKALMEDQRAQVRAPCARLLNKYLTGGDVRVTLPNNHAPIMDCCLPSLKVI